MGFLGLRPALAVLGTPAHGSPIDFHGTFCNSLWTQGSPIKVYGALKCRTVRLVALDVNTREAAGHGLSEIYIGGKGMGDKKDKKEHFVQKSTYRFNLQLPLVILT